jgi:hypothetical protein
MSRLDLHNNAVCNAIRDSDRSYLIFVPIYTAIFFVMYFGMTYRVVIWSLWKANEKAHAAEASRRGADRGLCLPQKKKWPRCKGSRAHAGQLHAQVKTPLPSKMINSRPHTSTGSVLMQRRIEDELSQLPASLLRRSYASTPSRPTAPCRYEAPPH